MKSLLMLLNLRNKLAMLINILHMVRPSYQGHSNKTLYSLILVGKKLEAQFLLG